LNVNYTLLRVDKQIASAPTIFYRNNPMTIIFTETEMKDQIEKKKAKLNEKIQKIIDAGNVKIEAIKAEIEKLDAVLTVMNENGL